ncbi:MAG: virulence RhuM family protein [Campylobacter sp.]|nr:virulence RhuM family protein [Campylobacter sp.]
MKSQIIIFQSEDKNISVDVLFDNETVWLNLDQIASLFEKNKSTISRHIKNIFDEGELEPNSVVANFATTAKDGKTYNVDFYNLDIIISVGYRVKSLRGTQFRKWATKHLNEFIKKGFVLDDERLKNGSNRYFKELLQRIRDIRSSERNFYQQVTDIYATAVDYDPKSKLTRNFFATVQNKMHYATHKHTAAEIIFDRVDSNKPFVGMTNFKGNYVTKDDVKIAKNYLNEKELQILNLLVSQFLDFAELQALEMRKMTMQDWINELDRQLKNLNRELLQDKGKISHEQAIQKASNEFEIYRANEMKNLQSDFDKSIKKLKKDTNEPN